MTNKNDKNHDNDVKNTSDNDQPEQERLELQEFKKELLNQIQIAADVGGIFSNDAFFDITSELLTEAGNYDDIQKDSYINSRRGIKIDGYNWNQMEGILSAIITKFSNDEDLITISKSEIEKLGKQASKFILNMDEKFKEFLDPSDSAVELAQEMTSYLTVQGKEGEDGYRQAAIKFRVIVVTDFLLSERVNLNKLKIEKIHDKETFFELWDLKRIKNLTQSGSESEPCDVDFSEICSDGGLSTLPANISSSGFSSYICMMPGEVLWKLYDNFGQRLLESNVRTFLQFRNQVNKGMKSTLLLNPENFFAYNNGLTVTASNIELYKESEKLLITKLDNMQIVNGGQTTSAIYFSPLTKGTQQGLDYRDIDLSKVFVQMKLTVIDDEDEAESMKEDIAKYANKQSAVQSSDFVSKHPIHREIEKHSRSEWAPPSENFAIPTKWFYERTRGQYQTRILALKTPSKASQFKAENPKEQMFTKIDMAKFENTWRMRPWEVAIGGQDHLGKKIGPILVKEWEQNPANFGIMFFKDLVAKAILFRTADSSIGKSAWYKAQIGLKAQTSTYTIAYLRYQLNKQGKDINLQRIYKSQKLSETLLNQILYLAPLVRDKLTECCFNNGNTNPAMYAKKIDAWEQIKAMPCELSIISDKDLLSKDQVNEMKESNLELNSENAEIDVMKICMGISDHQWEKIYEHLKQYIPKETKKMSTLAKFTQLSNAKMQARLSYPYDFKIAIELKDIAVNEYAFQVID